MVLAGASTKGVPHTGPTYDLTVREYASRVTLTAGNISFEFDRVVGAVRRFAAFVLPWIRETYAPVQIRDEPLVIASAQVISITRRGA